MSEGLEASKEFRLLVANYEDKWSKNTTEHFIKCADIIEKELKELEIIKQFLKNIRLEENEKGEYEILIDVVNSDKPLVIAIVNSKEKYDLLKEVSL